MRTLKIAVMAMMLLTALSFSKERKTKVYFNIADAGYSESYALSIQMWMEALDMNDHRYKIAWEAKAADADFIVSIFMNRDLDPSIITLKDGAKAQCNKYIAVTQLWKRGSGKVYEALNVQADCDQGVIAERAAETLEVAMGLKSGELSRR